MLSWQGFGFRVDNVIFRVLSLGLLFQSGIVGSVALNVVASSARPVTHEWKMIQKWFRVQNFGFLLSAFRFRVSGFGCIVYGVGFRVGDY